MSRLNRPCPWWALAAAVLISAYGALIRLDAFTGKYGMLERPAWARAVTYDLAPLARYLRPARVVWGREPRPYVGGDPIAYLGYARAMTSLYQPHVREPVFLATTRLALWTVDNQDAGISLASAAGSVLAIFATYLLAAALVSPVAGLVAAALMAIEYDAITWAVDGWRDDTFTAVFVLAAWALVRFHRRASFGNALLVGILGGLACLTRITSLSFILPALAWIVAAGEDEWRARVVYGATALVILAAAIAPFLISCALATGDPFLAINYHTGYYRFGEGLPNGSPMSAAEYIRLKFARVPVGTLDVASTGLFVRPFDVKWNGFDIWVHGLGAILSWSALAGMALWPFSPRGRLMLVMLAGALVPYAFTWNIAGGGEWRFTMHVYPLYIVAAVQVYATVLSRPWEVRAPSFLRRAAAAASGAALATMLYQALPWFVVREAIGKGEAVTITAGGRDLLFYRSGWSRPHVEGLASVRVSHEPRASVHFPLPQKRPYEIALRFDPVAPALQDRVTVLFNRQLLGRLHLSFDPQRVGSYRLALPGDWTKAGDNEITLVVEPMVAAADAGPRFTWLDPSLPLGVRMWYLRVLDSAPR